MERCSYRLANLHSGPKRKMPSRTYNLCVNHRRQILCTTAGHPARWNDKTIVLFDQFACDIKSGKALSDVEFQLLECNEEGETVSKTYRGVWMLVDNGYLQWATTIPPFKDPVYIADTKFSQWMESMRKDVECCFGMMKGRFRVLKAGIRLHSIEATDKIWHTCCALHNFLLDEDGLNTQWENGVQSDWEGSLGNHDATEVWMHIPLALRRLHADDPGALRNYDTSGMGLGNDVERDATFEEEEVHENTTNAARSNSTSTSKQ